MKHIHGSTIFKAVLVSLAIIGMRIPEGQAQALFLGAMPEQVTTYNGISPAAGTPDKVISTTTTTTASASNAKISLAPPVPIAPPDSIDSRVNIANIPAGIPNGARSDN